MILDDLGDLLSSGGTTGDGTELWLGAFTEQAGLQAIAIIEYGGQGPTHSMSTGPGKAVLESVRVQVACRAGDYQTARTKAHAIYKQLDGVRERTVNGVRYLWGSGVQPPFYLGQDEQRREQIVCNYEFLKQLSP